MKNFEIGSISCPLVSECLDFGEAISTGNFSNAALNAGLLGAYVVSLSGNAGSFKTVGMSQASHGSIVSHASAVSASSQAMRGSASTGSSSNSSGSLKSEHFDESGYV